MTPTSRRGRHALALALIVLTLALTASEAWARAGSGGSRGSRSFSRPAPPPASPVAPSSPARPSVAPARPAPPPASRGWLSPVMGGLAGFALGGMLGSLLFGGLGGGLGLMDLLLIGGALYLLVRLVARRAPQPAYATAGNGAPAGGADLAGVLTPAPVEAPDETARGIAHIQQMDAAFAPEAVVRVARGLFADVQRAVSARDVRRVSAALTPRMAAALATQCDRLRAARRTNRVEQIAVGRAEVTEAWQESGQDYVTVYLAGSLVDYTVDDATGEVVEGVRTPQDFEEFWTFARPVGPNPWKLSAIQTA